MMPVLKHEIKTFYCTKFGCGVCVSSAGALGFNTQDLLFSFS